MLQEQQRSKANDKATEEYGSFLSGFLGNGYTARKIRENRRSEWTKYSH